MQMKRRNTPLAPWGMRLCLLIALQLCPLLPFANPDMTGVAAMADDDDDEDDDNDDKPARPAPQPAGAHIVVSGLSEQQLSALRRQGWRVLSQRHNGTLAKPMALVQAPSGLRAPLQQLRQRYPESISDLNTLYRSNRQKSEPAAHAQQVGWTSTTQCSPSVAIGLIDTKVDTAHPALKGANIETLRLPERLNRRDSSSAHGTAVASLLVGQTKAVPGLTPKAKLMTVDAFHRTAQGQERMDAWDLVAALDLLRKKGARVINMSFAGQANVLLEQTLNAMHHTGIVTVASVGNRGPASPPQYPSAYPGVLGVTAVDARNQIYSRAGRGPHVDLAAPGVRLSTAGAKPHQTHTGTSFAAPFVTAAVATLLNKQRTNAIPGALIGKAVDLGPPGHDPVFGYGLLQMTDWCQ